MHPVGPETGCLALPHLQWRQESEVAALLLSTGMNRSCYSEACFKPHSLLPTCSYCKTPNLSIGPLRPTVRARHPAHHSGSLHPSEEWHVDVDEGRADRRMILSDRRGPNQSRCRASADAPIPPGAVRRD
ncbi:hypothetical protein SKAU_G00229720 [Synaphobranchus kaupii]|uniref:Uncharacterized protein n=1 Tax=Synaphobranchus kaupii TaxID=118154 RepID=A0A9Q1F5D8_SYNKA|nr:hypothetical protein SKAU_G00229720 [Synaphobranchus kaupii]